MNQKDPTYDKDLESDFIELQNQLNYYNREIVEKEKYFKEWAEKLFKKEKTLKESEEEIKFLNNETIPRLEAQSNKLNILLKELHLKKIEVDSKQKKIEKANFELEKKKNFFDWLKTFKDSKEERIFQLKNKKYSIKKFSKNTSEKIPEIIEKLKQEKTELIKEKHEYDCEVSSILKVMQKLSETLENTIFLIESKEAELTS